MRKAALALSALLAPAHALACPSCIRVNAEAQAAYYVATALMLAVPFLSIGLLVWWLRRRALRDPHRGTS